MSLFLVTYDEVLILMTVSPTVRFLISNKLEQLEFKLEKNIGM